MIIVEKIVGITKPQQNAIEKAVEDFAMKEYNFRDIGAIRKIVDDYIKDEKSTYWDLTDKTKGSFAGFTDMMRDPDILKQEFGSRIEEAQKDSPSNTPTNGEPSSDTPTEGEPKPDTPTEGENEKDMSSTVSGKTQDFEIKFNTKIHSLKPSSKKEAIATLRDWISQGGELRQAFIYNNLDKIYGIDPKAYQETVVYYCKNSNNVTNGGILGNCLEKLSAKDVKKFVTSMSLNDLHNSKNIFLSTIGSTNPSYADVVNEPGNFIKFYNTVATFAEHKNFSDYVGWENNIISFPEFYSKVEPNKEISNARTELVNYDINLGPNPGTTTITDDNGNEETKDNRVLLRNAIKENRWQGYAKKGAEQQVSNENHPDKDTEKINRAIGDLTQLLKKAGPNKVPEVVKDLMSSVNVTDQRLINDLSKAISGAINK